MADDKITILIEIDDQNVSQTFDKISVDADASASSIENSFDKKLLPAINSIDSSVRDLNRSLNATASGGLTAIFAGIAQAAAGSSRNLVTSTVAITATGASLIALSEATRASDSAFVRFNSTLSLIAGVALVGLGAIVGFAIIKIGELANIVGNVLVQAFQKSADVFVYADKQLLVFSKTIDNYNKITDQSSGSTAEWTETIDKLSNQLNFTNTELQKAAVEIVGVTSKLGFNREQMEQLLRVTSEYAKVTGKDLFDTTVAFVGALNGNAQAVTQYGVKLTEASNQHFLLKKGIAKSFDSLEESSKAQVRFNNLIEQFAGIAGVADAVSGSLADQQTRFEVQVQRLNQSLGKGAAIIERNNILYAAANIITSNLNETFLEFSGFIGALGSRILQIGGIFLKFSFQIFAVVKGITLLNKLLALDATQSAFARSIPVLNQSLIQLVTSLTGFSGPIKNVNDILLILSSGVRKLATSLLVLFTGPIAAGTGALAVFGQIATRVGVALSTVGTAALAAARVLLPPVAIISTLIGVFQLFKNAIQAVESRTGAFTTIFSAFKEEIARAGSIFQPIISGFNDLKSFVLDAAAKAFGGFVFALGKALNLLIETVLVINNVTGAFSNQFITKLKNAQGSLEIFNEELASVNFNLAEMATRGLAAASTKIVDPVNLNDLKNLRIALEDVGKSDLTKLKETLNERLTLLKNAFDQELITEVVYNDLKAKAQLDFELKRRQLNKETEIELSNSFDILGLKFGTVMESAKAEAQRFAEVGVQVGSMIADALGKLAADGVARLTKTLILGQNGFKNFGKFILSALGDLATQVGTVLLTAGVGMLALKGLDPTGAIIAGAALVALGTILSSMGEGTDTSSLATPGLAGGGGTFEPTDAFDPDDVERRKQSLITLNISGDVLDSQDTGLRIVDILRNYADKNGDVVTA